MNDLQNRQNRERPMIGARPASHPAGANRQSPLASTNLSPRTRRAVWQILQGDRIGTHSELDAMDRARLCVISNAEVVNTYVAERLLGDRFNPDTLSCLPVAALLELTARRDAEGALDVARRMRRQVDQCLLVYDMIGDKQQLFEGLSPERAGMVSRLWRLRRNLATLIVHLRGDGMPAAMPGQ